MKLVIEDKEYITNNRSKKIYQSVKRGAYFMINGYREYLDDYMRTNYMSYSPLYNAGLHAYKPLNNYGSRFISLSNDGESLKTYY